MLVILYVFRTNLVALLVALHKNWGFPSKISLVNVNKSLKKFDFVHIYYRNP